jgi:two-component system, chemotaxis family, chemotaxis protein CheY
MGRVVFVEDDPAIRKLVQVALRGSSHELHVATNGREGFELVSRLKPDIVFTDVSMPEMDGMQLADAIRARADLAGTRIVFVTASVQRDQIADYERHGANGYLAKPFSTKALREEIARLMPA